MCETGSASQPRSPNCFFTSAQTAQSGSPFLVLPIEVVVAFNTGPEGRSNGDHGEVAAGDLCEALSVPLANAELPSYV